MAVKKRKLSPSASSRSSATPAPAPSSLGTPTAAGIDGIPSTIPQPASPNATGSEGAHGDRPERSSVSVQREREALPVGHVERTVAKLGVVQPGSGDGAGCGDECFMWADLPMNKHGFRYEPCAPSPRQSPSPLHPFYRSLPAPPPCPPVHISWVDRSPFLRLSADGSTCTTDRGFRAGRATASVRHGTWYYEVHVLRGTAALGGRSGTGGDAGNAHVRVGWGRREAGMDAPVGADGYSYAIRDVGGEAVHTSRLKQYGRAFGEGDVVGCMITLPPRSDHDAEVDAPRRVAIRYKGQLYFEADDPAPIKEMEMLMDREGKIAAARKAAEAEAAAAAAAPKGKKTKNTKTPKLAPNPFPEQPLRALPTLEGSSVRFFLNGEALADDPAYSDLYEFRPLPPASSKTDKHKERDRDKDKGPVDDGSIGYYPMLSCFGRGKLRLNCGPDFAFPPPESYGARAMADRAAEYHAEMMARDERDEVALSTRLERELAEDRARMERAEQKIAAAAKKKAARVDAAAARKVARVASGTPGPAGGMGVGVSSGLAREVYADEEEGEGEEVKDEVKMERDAGALSAAGDTYAVKLEMPSRPGTTPSSPAPFSEAGAESDMDTDAAAASDAIDGRFVVRDETGTPGRARGTPQPKTGKAKGGKGGKGAKAGKKGGKSRSVSRAGTAGPEADLSGNEAREDSASERGQDASESAARESADAEDAEEGVVW